MLYSHLHVHAASQRHNNKDAWRKTQEDFFTIIFTSHFIARVCMWEVLETEHKLHILTPLLWPSRCVLFFWCWGPLHRGFPRALSVGCGFHYHICSLAVWNSTGNCIGGFPSAPSVGCGLPYHIYSLLSGSLPATALGPKLNWVK